jgi:preprotein translocase subunit Sss1
LFALIAARGEYGWAAGRYREQARERAGDQVAPRQMDRIRRAIEATMVVTATARDKPQASPYKNTATLLGVLIVLLIVGTVYMLIKSRGSASPDDQPPPPPPRAVSPTPQVR